ncbi:Oligopeptide transport ATP-binding protein OppD [subsurface metagenome]
MEVNDLKAYFYLDEGILKAVDGVSFKVRKEKVLGLVGESGCGKSVTAQSILRIVPAPGKIEGEILLQRNNGNAKKVPLDLAKLDPRGKEIRSIRGKEISMIFQEPMTSFSPLHTIGNQIIEAILLHQDVNKEEARKLAIDMLDKVGIATPQRRIDEYPHQLSGGMRQRAMIAMALSCNPSILIADEPTTALDVTVQAQILELMKSLQAQFGMSIIYITHNLGVIAEISDEVAAMYLGRIVEYASVDDLFYDPLHPYTRALLKSIPKIGKKAKAHLESIEGTVPLPLDLPADTPPLVEVKKEHRVRCFLYN